MRKKHKDEIFEFDDEIVIGKEWKDAEELPADAPREEAMAKGKNIFLVAVAALVLLGAVGAFFILPALLNSDIFKELGQKLSFSAEKQKTDEVAPAQTLPKKPSLLSITIKEAPTTNKDEVFLKLYAKGAEKCRFSNDGSVWSEWYAYSEQAKWKLSDGDGNKTVYYQCKNIGGIADAVSTKVYLDKTLPSLSLSVSVQNNQIQIIAKATDDNPYGFNCKLIVNGEEKDSFSGSYSKYFYVEKGNHKIVAVCIDAAGNNASADKEVMIAEEKKEETVKKQRNISIIINNGAAETNSRYLTLTLYADDGYLCRYKEGNEAWTSYESYATTKSWSSKVSESQKITIYYECKDKNDVLIGQAQDSIEYVKSDKLSGSSTTTGGSSSSGSGNYVAPRINSAAFSLPSGSSLVAGFTKNYLLTLTMSAQGITECRYRNIPWEPEPVWSAWMPYSASRQIELLGPRGGDGDRLVQIECRNSAGTVVTNEARIIYDGTPPEPVDTSRPEDMTLIYSEEINGVNRTYVMILWLPTSDAVSGVYSYNIDRMAVSEGRIRTNYAVILENRSTFYQFIEEIDPRDVYIYGFTTYDKANNAASSTTLLYCDPSQPLPANCH